jgi:acyl-coenzyme A thioesterase PaaI-like protein
MSQTPPKSTSPATLWQPPSSYPYPEYPSPDHAPFLERAKTATPEDNETDPVLIEANARATARQIAFFRAIPWCAAILDRPGLAIQQAESRHLNRTTLDTLMSRALNSPFAIPQYIIFYDPEEGLKDAKPEEPLPLITQMQALVALGPMVNGWAGICHGGIIATLLDETLGQIFSANGRHGRLPGKKETAIPIMTGYLNVKYLKPTKTGTVENPNVVLITANIIKRDGRKFFMKANMKDSEGQVLSEADALFVMLKSKL